MTQHRTAFGQNETSWLPCPELQRAISRHLPRARICMTPLRDVPEIRLWLLNADYCSEDLHAEDIQRIMRYPAYWSFCWASGQVLARYLLDNPELVRGKTVLDFGCGSGVAGIAAARAGAGRVIACDLDPDACLATRENAALNGVQLELVADFWQARDPVDLVLAADVLYDRANMAWLPRFLEHANKALVADSRVRDFAAPGYRRIAGGESRTWPDLDEHDAFRHVSLYLGQRPAPDHVTT